MTLLTQDNFINYGGSAGQTIFPYPFRVDNTVDMFVAIDNVTIPQGDYSVNGVGSDNGGTVVLNTPLPDSAAVTLFRVVDLTQETDYQPFDAFPAETHELALDKLTMIDQQISERVIASLRFPVGDDKDVELPTSTERAEKYLYFDIDGNASVTEAVPDGVSITAIRIAPDSDNMLDVDTGPDYQQPILSIKNINQPHGMVQLNNNGKVPFEVMGVGGIALRGPIRGDDLCDKRGDDPGDCIYPDSRNPSERFPDLVPTEPFEPNKFSTGDMFVLTFEDPEVDGTMNLFTAIGGVEEVIDVGQRDAIIFISGWDSEGEPLTEAEQGWYYLPKLYEVGDASSIVYPPDGNYIIQVSDINVKLALDRLDENAVDINDRPQSVDGLKTFLQPITQVPEGVNNNHLMRKVDIEAEIQAVEDQLADYLPLAGGELSSSLTISSSGPAMILSNTINGLTADFVVFSTARDFRLRITGGSWQGGAVSDILNINLDTGVARFLGNVQSSSEELDAADLTRKVYVDTKKQRDDFLRTGTRLDIFNVRTS